MQSVFCSCSCTWHAKGEFLPTELDVDGSDTNKKPPLFTEPSVTPPCTSMSPKFSLRKSDPSAWDSLSSDSLPVSLHIPRIARRILANIKKPPLFCSRRPPWVFRTLAGSTTLLLSAGPHSSFQVRNPLFPLKVTCTQLTIR